MESEVSINKQRGQLVLILFAKNPDTPSVTLATGEIIKGDMVIAADGIHSIAVGHVLGHENPAQPQKLYNGCFRFLISAHEIEDDTATAWWLASSDGVMRMFVNGKDGNRLVTYPCRKLVILLLILSYLHLYAVLTKEQQRGP